MKKRAFAILFVFLILSLSFVLADVNATTDQAKVDKAYDCLEDKVDGKCSSLSLQEKIFTLMAIGKCKTEVLAEAKNNKCWPKPNCNIKTTAQAVLALSEANTNTDDEEAWLLAQTKTPEDLIWYLQIDSDDPTTCSISYSGSTYQITIGADKKIDSAAGSCLTPSQDSYWLRIGSGCYDYEYSILCDKGFITNLLYKRKTSDTIYVSDKTSSASAEGTTTEKVESSCFTTGSTCDYEGSLWAAMVLDAQDQDVSSYLPYLVTMAEDNKELMPEMFLYLLTAYPDFRTTLLLKQKNDEYWDESGEGKFFDTALALYPFHYKELNEKTSSMEWLLEVQDKDGCWQGNIRDTAFILYSIWPETQVTETEPDCEEAGYFCMPEIDCQGNILPEYDCAGVLKCCDTQEILQTCAEQGGEICESNENCVSGTIAEAPDTDLGQVCCLGGECVVPITTWECEDKGGTCRSYGCGSDEIESTDECDSGQTCCIKKPEKQGGYWWIWLLLILIILVILAIIYKDKVRVYWMKIKSGFGKPSGAGTKPSERLPPTFQGPAPTRAPQRKILPPTQRRPRTPTRKPKGEIDEVLKKLKDMGK